MARARTHFHALLQKRAEELLRNKAEDIASGAIEDYPDYRYQCGVLQGMKMLLELADEIEKEMD